MDYKVGMNPTITLAHCNADLKIEAYDGDTVSINDLDYDAQPQIAHQDSNLAIGDFDADCLMRVPYGTTFNIDQVAGDLQVQGVHHLSVDVVHGDCKLNNVDTFKCDTVDGDVKAIQSRELQLGDVNGDVQIDQLTEAVTLNRIEGDLSVSNSQANVTFNTVDGDLRLDKVAGMLSGKRVTGDAVLRGDVQGFDALTINGDGKFQINWLADHDYRATVNGDAVLEFADDADVTLSATVHGDISGIGMNNTGSSRNAVGAVWGDGSARIELTVNGDLIVRSGVDPQHTGAGWGAGWGGSWGASDELKNSFRDLIEEFTAMGREIASQFADVSREWKSSGSDRMAERMRQAADRMAQKATDAAERVSVRINDREIRFDPDRLERIKEQARRAADEGIARAQEAIDRAMDSLERNLSGRGRPPMPPRPLAPSRFPQKINIMDNDGSSSTNTVQSPATGDTINLKNEKVPTNDEAKDVGATASDKTQERLAILKMVQSGKISADEAAMLLDALG